MTWIPLLLTDPSACLRYLVLKDLLGRSENDSELQEFCELRPEDPLIKNLEELQQNNGAWESDGVSIVGSGNILYSTSMALQRLGYLQIEKDHPMIQKAAEYIFSKQRDDGSWPMPGKKELDEEEVGYQMMPIQTAIPLLGLAMCGYYSDKRAEKAYEWLLKQRLEDGAWPVGIASGNYGGIAGYRRIAHSRWGCRSNTLAVLSCLAYHPKRKASNEAQKALDLILGTKIFLRNTIGFNIARLIGLEKSIGRITFMARFDMAQILDLCWRVEASKNDVRIEEFINFVKEKQGKNGIWEYLPYPRASRWITFDLLRTFSNLDDKEDWISFEPSTPFSSYLKKKLRF